MRLILGGPGTGKTTRLLSIVEEEIASGIDPSRIAFVSFTRKAANEAAERAAKRFDFDRSQLPYFRTLHSIAYAHANVTKSEVMGNRDYRDFGNLVGMGFNSFTDAEGPIPAGADGSKMLQIVSYARATCTSLEEAWHATGEGVEWHALKYFADSLKHYKRDMFKLDFDDMLDRFVDNCEPLDLDVVIIDEAQDLSVKQWQVAQHMFRNVPEIYVAGDDDQAIYRWSGADVNHFLQISDAPEVLPVSYRLPGPIFDMANEVSQRIGRRYAKNWQSAGHEGNVIRATVDEEFDLANGTWMFLARSHHFLQDFRHQIELLGYAYKTTRKSSVDEDEVRAIILYEALRKGEGITGHALEHVNGYLGHNRIDLHVEDDEHVTRDDVKRFGVNFELPWYDQLLTIGDATRQYYQSILRNGEKLTDEPRIYTGTIHSVKGGEADNVVLCTDITYRTRQSYDLSPDDEHRVFYTGLTRARHNLFVLDPIGNEYYDI